MTERVRTIQQVLVIDDEPDLRELLALTLERMQLQCVEAATLEEAKNQLARHRFALCLTDMRLPDGDGLSLVKLIQHQYPDLPVAVITAHGNMETAITALKAGAFDFLNKPLDLGDLRALIRSALRLSQQQSTPLKTTSDSPRLLGESDAMNRIRHLVSRLARSQAPVHISGESGTGKEVVAREIHLQGHRANQPFLAVNCGAIPRDLMESELFGHVKGSFTGAYGDKSGLFSAADGGTLFLDEVAELPLDMQVKLLRAIQEKAIRPVGATREQPTDVRILSATHSDLGARVRCGEFREDLYYRINVIEVPVPPLRDRREDIMPLAEHCLARLAQSADGHPLALQSDAQQALLDYDFPGNVRELENILERAAALCEGGQIAAWDLQLSQSVQYLSPESTPPVTDDLAGIKAVGLEAHLEGVERRLIEAALSQTRQNKTAAARELGISFRALRYRLKKLGLE